MRRLKMISTQSIAAYPKIYIEQKKKNMGNLENNQREKIE